ncbi:RNA-directed DNA polymerase [Spirillospora sp. NPDC047279]|uniref:RNA-directed DNA polymerase n=1 Tax=Spirillospora sp. NPDC047279 TaxID=3155478 RepID=UPI003406853D
MPTQHDQSIVDNLEVAWAHLGISSGDLDMPDLISHADIEFDWEAYRNKLIERIRDGVIGPLQLDVVDLPKDALNVRPLVRMLPSDRLIYDAAVFATADKIAAAFPRGVYSYRWWKARKALLGANMWIKMQRSARFLHEKHPELLLARTDVTAFYENIESGILMEDVEALGVPSWSTSTLRKCLSSFNSKTGVWGIPQGSDASGLLANLYLFPLDNEISRRGFRHYRYSDDIYIFGEDWVALREMLLEANRILRYRHLTLSGAKTTIYRSREIGDVFEDDEKDAIGYGVRNLDVGSIEDLHALFDRTTGRYPINGRDLRYCLTKLAAVYDDYAAAWLLANLGDLPHIARESLIYLGNLPWLSPYITKAVVDLLVNSKLVMYPYAEQHLLIYMINHEAFSKDGLKAAWELLLDKNKAGFVREFAARYIGVASQPGSALRLKQEFQLEKDQGVRRALLIACYESGQCTERWLNEVWKSVPDLRLTAKYLLANPSQIPRPVTERRY